MFSQNKISCNELISESNSYYGKKDFIKSLSIFKKALVNKCNLTEIEFYNGACIAALAMNQKLALSYLQTSVIKGYEDTLHMSKDSDLDLIRKTNEYRNIIKIIERKFLELKKELSNFNFQNIELAIPYTYNEKWGWLNKNSLKPICKPIFDYTDFKSAKGLFFVYKAKKYIFSNDLKIQTTSEIEEQNGVMGRMESEPETYKDTSKINGFIAKDEAILRFSDRFLNVTLVKENNTLEQLGIAIDKSNIKALIFRDGSFYKHFNFKFTDINYFWGRVKQTYFITKEENRSEYKIYDRAGLIASNETINGYEFIENYQLDPQKKYIFIGFPKILKITIGNKQNILDKLSLSAILHKNYEKIIMINGPTDDSDRTGSSRNYGLKENYFLVKENTFTFYVDEKGTEYKIK